MKVYLKKINKEYLVETENHYKVTIEIDGKRFLDFKEGWISQKPKTIQIIKKETRVIFYGELTPEDYQVEIDKLIPSKDNYDYPVFDNLDQEYAYKKFQENHKAIYEDYEEKIAPEIIEWDITGRTDNEFIIPFRFIGKAEVKDNETLYEYTPNPYKMAQEIAKKLKLKEIEDGKTNGMEWCVPDHSRDSLRFTNIAGNYANYESLPGFHKTTGTWNECEEVYNKHYNAIKSMFEKEIKRLNSVGKKYDKAKIMGELELLKNMISKINVKTKSDIKPFEVVSKINKIIENL
jgi:hypothetical protein